MCVCGGTHKKKRKEGKKEAKGYSRTAITKQEWCKQWAKYPVAVNPGNKEEYLVTLYLLGYKDNVKSTEDTVEWYSVSA